MCAPPGRRKTRRPKTTELVTLSDVRARALARPPWQQARGWPRGAERNFGHVTWDVTGGRSVQSPVSSFELRHFAFPHRASTFLERGFIHGFNTCRSITPNDILANVLRSHCDRGVTVLSRRRPHLGRTTHAPLLAPPAVRHPLRHHRRTAPLMCGHKKGRRIDDRSSHEQRRSHGRSAKVCLSLQDQAAPAQAAHTSPSSPQHPGAGRQRQRTHNSSRWLPIVGH